MCYGCWEDFGFPMIRNERTEAAAVLVRDVYEHSPVGGNLHVIADDWNIEDEHFERGLDCSPGTTPRQHECEKRCFDALKAMTLDERASALAIHDGFDRLRLQIEEKDVPVSDEMRRAVDDLYPYGIGGCDLCHGDSPVDIGERVYRRMEAVRRIAEKDAADG